MDVMTVFYRKSTGDLTEIIQGEQSMSLYGTLEADYTLIYSFIIVDYDDFVMRNKTLFCIIDGAIKLKNISEISKYL